MAPQDFCNRTASAASIQITFASGAQCASEELHPSHYLRIQESVTRDVYKADQSISFRDPQFNGHSHAR
jgi:hypothetical protein